MADGTIALPPPDLFVSLLRLMPRLECVFLNACHTLHPDARGKSLGERIVEALPDLTVIGWRSLTEDRAAEAFSRGFYDALARGLVGGGGGKVSIAEAYASGALRNVVLAILESRTVLARALRPFCPPYYFEPYLP